MVTITVSEYFEEGGADEYATLRVESDAIGQDMPECTKSTGFLTDSRAGTQWITVVPAGENALSVRIAASAVRSPGVKQELERLITSLTKREDALRRSGQSVHENNRVLDHLVISLTENEKDGASVVSRMMSSATEVPKGHKWYDTALARSPDDAMAWNAKGEAMAAAGRTSEAKECFTCAVKIDPAYSDARYNLNHVEGMGRTG
ncbi:tetratricopeptide repeat protein [Methanogenium sp. S4BF]|uniref:tetratricopeptide repeat protein n=1 Tax=Methanogenium sp. S4BF TaxID=1789226 RepID=UPI002415E53B|nr:tetratricopeptide repeat protein [Methanogenium sp. S4BF]WFN33470.1 tetratricopeptide repeat protein [Methanogenium sp. S4BF]